ncbi:hypothetical protein C8Q76DRAFT_798178 [Earliella scabrosa]|nr:hypothetical protein C8Q76DRAFT_798178 [Earliella scabrosa]
MQVSAKLTHNDGSTRRSSKRPAKNSYGNPYSCDSTKCVLHIHSYTRRYNVPPLMAVGTYGTTRYEFDQGHMCLSYGVGCTPRADELMHVKVIVNVPADTSRRFILLGYHARTKTTAVDVLPDILALTKKSVLGVEQPDADDSELWNPCFRSEALKAIPAFRREAVCNAW